MKKLLEFLVKSIVNHPKEVKITESMADNDTTLVISVHPEDVKIVIGKKGRTIRALRELTSIKAILTKKKVAIKVEG